MLDFLRTLGCRKNKALVPLCKFYIVIIIYLYENWLATLLMWTSFKWATVKHRRLVWSDMPSILISRASYNSPNKRFTEIKWISMTYKRPSETVPVLFMKKGTRYDRIPNQNNASMVVLIFYKANLNWTTPTWILDSGWRPIFCTELTYPGLQETQFPAFWCLHLLALDYSVYSTE